MRGMCWIGRLRKGLRMNKHCFYIAVFAFCFVGAGCFYAAGSDAPSVELLRQTASAQPTVPVPPDTMASVVEEYGCRRLAREQPVRFSCRIGIRYHPKTSGEQLLYHEWIFRHDGSKWVVQ